MQPALSAMILAGGVLSLARPRERDGLAA
jgi:hypothetical protein